MLRWVSFFPFVHLSTNGMMALMRAFNACYRTIENRSGLKTRLIATGLTINMTFVLFLAIILLVVGQFMLELSCQIFPAFDWINMVAFTVILLFILRFITIFIAFFLAISFTLLFRSRHSL